MPLKITDGEKAIAEAVELYSTLAKDLEEKSGQDDPANPETAETAGMLSEAGDALLNVVTKHWPEVAEDLANHRKRKPKVEVLKNPVADGDSGYQADLRRRLDKWNSQVEAE